MFKYACTSSNTCLLYMYMYMYSRHVYNLCASCIGFPNQQFIINYLFHDISTWDNGTYRSEDIQTGHTYGSKDHS